MDCEEARGLLIGALDQGLPFEGKDALKEHLSACEACRVEAAAFEEVSQALRSLQLIPPPFHVKARLLRAIEAERKREKRVLSALRRLLPAPVAASLASLGVALWFPYQAFADLCHSWLGRSLGTAEWPMEPFFFLTGFLYSSLPMGAALGLLSRKVDPSPSRSGLLAGGLFFLVLSPYILFVCLGMEVGSAVSLGAGFLAGTFLSSLGRAWVWKMRLRVFLA